MKNQRDTEICPLIEKIIKTHGLKPTELAATVGISVPTLGRWQKNGLPNKYHKTGAVTKIRALAEGKLPAVPILNQTDGYGTMTISLKIDLRKIDTETLVQIRNLKKVLSTLESLEKQK
ncbi:MAG: hypothetical protein Q7R65_02600 [bacterium]|nr:hypothetical protein [bacterium]